MRDLYKNFLKQGILPDAVDRQDFNTLIWVVLSLSHDAETKGDTGDTPIMGLL